MMKNNFPVSVIICAFNAENYLEKTLHSVVNQTYSNIEILIIDDASTDSTAQIISDASMKDHRIRYIRNESNEGIASARQKGLENAMYEWVLFVDADDIALPEMISFQVDAIIKDRDLIGVGTYSYYIGEDEKKILGIQAIGPISKDEFFRLFDKKKMLFLLPNTLFSKKHAIEVGGYRCGGFPLINGVRLQDFCEDLDLWCRLSDFGLQGKYLKALSTPLFYYRKDLNSLSSKNVFYMTKKMRWIKDCLKHRRTGCSERSFNEYLTSLSIWKKFKHLLSDYAAYYYKIAAFYYLNKKYIRAMILIPISFFLNPTYIFDKLKTQKMRNRK